MARACDRCGRLLEENALRYVVEVTITADVSPYLDTERSEAEVVAEIKALLETLSKASAREAEEEIHQRMAYLLCPTCKLAFARDPLRSGHSGHSRLQ